MTVVFHRSEANEDGGGDYENDVKEQRNWIVVLDSDGSVVHKGFSATWKSVEAAAMPTSGEIKSPNYPDKYPDNLNRKEYKIVVATGKKVELTSSAQGPKCFSRWSCPSSTWRSRRTGQRARMTTSRPTTHLLGDLRPWLLWAFIFLFFEDFFSTTGHLWHHGQVWDAGALDRWALGERSLLILSIICLALLHIFSHRWAPATSWRFTSPRTARSTSKASGQLGSKLIRSCFYWNRSKSWSMLLMFRLENKFACITFWEAPLTPSTNESDNIGQSPVGQESIWGLLLI